MESSIRYDPSACVRLISENAKLNSSGVRAGTKLSLSDSAGAAASRSAIAFGCQGVSGFHRTTTRVSRGIASLSSCSRLAPSSAVIRDSPVTFPPGRARLATKPEPAGSATRAMTMGMVDVAPITACIARVLCTTITSIRSRASPNLGSLQKIGKNGRGCGLAKCTCEKRGWMGGSKKQNGAMEPPLGGGRVPYPHPPVQPGRPRVRLELGIPTLLRLLFNPH